MSSLIFYKWNEGIFRELLNSFDLWPIDYVGSKIEKEQLKMYSFVYNLARIESIFAVLALVMNLLILTATHDDYYCHYYNNTSPCFELMTAGALVDMVLQMSFVNGFNILFYGFLTHAYCQIRMLKTVFRSIYDEKDNRKRKEMFKTCIEYHNKLLV